MSLFPRLIYTLFVSAGGCSSRLHELNRAQAVIVRETVSSLFIFYDCAKLALSYRMHSDNTKKERKNDCI